MKVGIVTVWAERGAGIVSRQYSEAIQRQGGKSLIYARGGEVSLSPLSSDYATDVYWGKRFNIGVPTYVDKADFLRWLRVTSPDLVLFNEQHWWEPIVWCREQGIPTVAYVDYYKEDTLPLFGLYDALVCNTQRHFEAFSWHRGAVFIPWGTDLTRFTSVSARSFSENRPVAFAHSAGMSPKRKGTDFVIKALEKLKRRCTVLIHSQTGVSYSSFDPRIEMIDRSVSQEAFFGLADIYLYPTRLEGIGLTVVEAIASGLPAIVPNYQPMNEFVNDKCGRLIAIDRIYSRADGYYWPQVDVDIDSLVEQMEWYIDNSRSLKSFKVAARAEAERRFDWFQNSKDILKMFSSIGLSSGSQLETANAYFDSWRKSGLNKLSNVIAGVPRWLKKAYSRYRDYKK